MQALDLYIKQTHASPRKTKRSYFVTFSQIIMEQMRNKTKQMEQYNVTIAGLLSARQSLPGRLVFVWRVWLAQFGYLLGPPPPAALKCDSARTYITNLLK